MLTVWKARTHPFSLWVCPEKHIHLKIDTVVLELTADELNTLATLSKAARLTLQGLHSAKMTLAGR